jgi:hypothetical protein
MTAVEWLLDRVEDVDLNPNFWEQIKLQALELEKQQIIDAHFTGLIYPLEMEASVQAEQYYNETYKTKTESGKQIDFLIKKLNIAKEALNNIAAWNDDLENEYGDPGECAIEALIKIRNL